MVVVGGAGRVDTPQTISAKFVSAPHPACSFIQVVFLKKICPLNICILYSLLYKHFTQDAEAQDRAEATSLQRMGDRSPPISSPPAVTVTASCCQLLCYGESQNHRAEGPGMWGHHHTHPRSHIPSLEKSNPSP